MKIGAYAKMNTKQDGINALCTLKEYMPLGQLSALSEAIRGEEREYFIDKLVALTALIATMPKTYEQENLGDQAIVSLHYFRGNMDWYITEKDVETIDNPGQHQAFGLADFGNGGELGYISIVELVKNGVELDLYFTPCTIASVRNKQTLAKV